MVNEKIKTNKTIVVGLEMLDLIKRVRTKFEKEYGFKPQVVEVTNLIARRVNENQLF